MRLTIFLLSSFAQTLSCANDELGGSITPYAWRPSTLNNLDFGGALEINGYYGTLGVIENAMFVKTPLDVAVNRALVH